MKKHGRPQVRKYVEVTIEVPRMKIFISTFLGVVLCRVQLKGLQVACDLSQNFSGRGDRTVKSFSRALAVTSIARTRAF